MKQDYRCREACPADLDEIYSLIDRNMANFRSKKALQDELLSENYFNYLLCSGDEIIGICNFFLMLDYIDLNLILIDKKYRDLGLGRSLLEKSIEHLKLKIIETQEKEKIAKSSSTEVEQIFINLEVSIFNSKAISLYQSFNFKELSRRKDYYSKGEDAIFMRRLLF